MVWFVCYYFSFSCLKTWLNLLGRDYALCKSGYFKTATLSYHIRFFRIRIYSALLWDVQHKLRYQFYEKRCFFGVTNSNKTIIHVAVFVFVVLLILHVYRLLTVYFKRIVVKRNGPVNHRLPLLKLRFSQNKMILHKTSYDFIGLRHK